MRVTDRSRAERVAGVGTTLAAGLSLTNVIGSGRWLLAGALSAIAPHVLFWITRHFRETARAAIVFFVGLALSAYLVEMQTLAAGFPTTATIRDYARDLSKVPEVLQTGIVPVAPHGAVLLLALGSVWLTGTAAEWLSSRRVGALTVLWPSIALFVSVSALGDGETLVPTAVYALSIVFYLLAERHADLIQRVPMQTSKPRRSRLASGGFLLGVLIVGTASVIGPALPGARSEAWVDYRSIGDDIEPSSLGSESPMISIQAQLRDFRGGRSSGSRRTAMSARTGESRHWIPTTAPFGKRPMMSSERPR